MWVNLMFNSSLVISVAPAIFTFHHSEYSYGCSQNRMFFTSRSGWEQLLLVNVINTSYIYCSILLLLQSCSSFCEIPPVIVFQWVLNDSFSFFLFTGYFSCCYYITKFKCWILLFQVGCGKLPACVHDGCVTPWS